MTDRRKAVEANVSRNKCGVLQNEPNSTRSLWRPTTEVRAVTRHDGVRPLRPEIEFIDENGRAPSVGDAPAGADGAHSTVGRQCGSRLLDRNHYRNPDGAYHCLESPRDRFCVSPELIRLERAAGTRRAEDEM
jgi:hypothetical protein